MGIAAAKVHAGVPATGCTFVGNCNLLPVCERHHQKIHNDGWTIHLGANRELTLTLPDGQIMTTGPPKRSAA
jgi:hypothetical protein